MKPLLLMTGHMMPLTEEGIARHYEVVLLNSPAELEPALAKHAGSFEAICTGGHTGVRCDDALLARMPKLRIIGNFGVGYDSVDAAAAARRGIIVTNTPDVLNDEVADTAIGLMLMTVRELSKAESYLRAGHWAAMGEYPLTRASLRDRSLGIVGMGRIGKAIAGRADAFGLPISYHARRQHADVAYKYYPDLIAMARDVDTLLVITPGGPETKNLINAAVLEALGPRGILINVARGTVVDEPALIAALKARTIMAAGLDVYWNEPKISPELLQLENAVLLPHVGSASQFTRDRMGQLVVDNVASFALRKPPVTPVAETPFTSW